MLTLCSCTVCWLLLVTVGALNICVLCGYTPFKFLLQVDASSRFEMEIFEFHNILQTDDFPKCWVSPTFQYSRTKMPSRRSIGL